MQAFVLLKKNFEQLSDLLEELAYVGAGRTEAWVGVGGNAL